MWIECDDSETFQGFVDALKRKDIDEAAVEMAKQSMVNKFEEQRVNATDTCARRAIELKYYGVGLCVIHVHSLMDELHVRCQVLLREVAVRIEAM